ncbi:MAG: hypothetical protein QXT63_02810, partial [Thermoplasmata archaeon]
KTNAETPPSPSIYPNFQEIHPGETAFFIIEFLDSHGTYTLLLEGLPQDWTYNFNYSENDRTILSITPPIYATNFGLVNFNLIIQSQTHHTIPFTILFSNSILVLSIPQIVECSPNMTVEIPLHAYNRLGNTLNFTIYSQNRQIGNFSSDPHETLNFYL